MTDAIWKFTAFVLVFQLLSIIIFAGRIVELELGESTEPKCKVNHCLGPGFPECIWPTIHRPSPNYNYSEVNMQPYVCRCYSQGPLYYGPYNNCSEACKDYRNLTGKSITEQELLQGWCSGLEDDQFNHFGQFYCEYGCQKLFHHPNPQTASDKEKFFNKPKLFNVHCDKRADDAYECVCERYANCRNISIV